MGRNTKKVGSTRGLGTRYGATLRKRYLKVVTEAKRTHKCPQCGAEAVKRVSVGVWHCKKCDVTFAGCTQHHSEQRGRRVLLQLHGPQHRPSDPHGAHEQLRRDLHGQNGRVHHRLRGQHCHQQCAAGQHRDACGHGRLLGEPEFDRCYHDRVVVHGHRGVEYLEQPELQS